MSKEQICQKLFNGDATGAYSDSVQYVAGVLLEMITEEDDPNFPAKELIPVETLKQLRDRIDELIK